MERALKTVESLKLTSIVCVFDQAKTQTIDYSKAIEIKWKERQKFNGQWTVVSVLMMGMFHMLMMFMHTLSRRFSAAGLRDVLIQSSGIAESSVAKATSEKMYNRGVQLYKLAYETIMRKLFDGIVLTKKEDDWVQANLEKLDFDAFWENISPKMHNDF